MGRRRKNAQKKSGAEAIGKQAYVRWDEADLVHLNVDRVRKAMKDAGYTLRQASMACGKGEGYFGAVFASGSRVRTAAAQRLADILHMPYSEIVTDGPPPFKLEAGEPDGLPPRYDVLIYNVRRQKGLEVTMQTHWYPTWRGLAKLCTDNGIDATDFLDLENCADAKIRTINGVVYGLSTDHVIADYVITKLTNDEVAIDELLR